MRLISTILHFIEPWYCRWDRWRTRRWFVKNAKRYPVVQPQNGITIIGSFENPVSLSKVLRDLAFRLKAAGFPFQAYSTSARRLVPDDDVDPILTSRKDFCAIRYSHVLEMTDSVFPAEELGLKRLTVSFWEFDSGYLDHSPEMIKKSHIVGMSDFTVTYFKHVFPSKVRVSKLLYPFRAPNSMDMADGLRIREKYKIPKSSFAVFFNFDYGSGYHRKSPYAVVTAFAKAFKPNDNAVLVMKTMQSQAHTDKQDELIALMTELGVADRCIFVNNYVPMSELYALTNACDAYISLHRGEGFGLGICEAMSMGKPVVVTNYSANTEFCNKENAMLIPCKMVRPSQEQQDVPYYQHVTSWAEPDVDCAAKALRELYDNPERRKKLGENAKAFIADHFSNENFYKSVAAMIAVSD